MCPRRWCGSNKKTDPCGFLKEGAAWRVEDLKLFLQLHNEYGWRYNGRANFFSGYNEVVVDSGAYNDHLPHSIMAFFTMEGQSTVSNLASHKCA